MSRPATRLSSGWTWAAPVIFLVMVSAATYVLAVVGAFIQNPPAAWADPVGALKGEQVKWLHVAVAAFLAPVPTGNHTLQIVELFGRRPVWSRWPLVLTCALLPVVLFAVAWVHFAHAFWPMLTAGAATVTLWMIAAGVPRDVEPDGMDEPPLL